MTGAELFIGGRFASTIITKVVDLGKSYLRDNKDLHTGTKEMLTKLGIQLPRIQSVIEAAEERQITNKGLVQSLELLKDAAYEAEDVMDKFEAKRIRENIKGKGKVSEIVSSSVKMVKTLFFSDNDLKELKSLVNKLDELCKEYFITTYKLIRSEKMKEHWGNLGRETSSSLAPGVEIFGREREIGLILDMIFNVLILYGGFNNEDLDDRNSQQGKGEASSSSGAIPGKSKVSEAAIKGNVPESHSISNQKPEIISIVGLGGVGKTAIAKKIYNNDRMIKHFSLIAWVYVSENFDAKKIMRDILCSFDGGMIDSQINLENVGKMLKETIKNNRFFIILDDLRDMTMHNWRELMSVLYNGEIGSVVVVTTQSTTIANTISTIPEVTLDILQPESFWQLFQHYAFAGFKLKESNKFPSEQPKVFKLLSIGKEIAEKLHGLPLAGEVIGTLLSKEIKRERWEHILSSDWWNIEEACKGILPSIGVGYNYLDSELKQCFVFCSIFPKQYVFERERLVHMWIAHGFIQPCEVDTGRLDRGEIRLEDIGKEWFDELVDRSFFQPTLCDGKYVMHDLVRDLAIAVSSNEFCFIKRHNNHLPLLAHHMGIDCDNSAAISLPNTMWECHNSTKLRTVILFGNWTNCSDKSISNIFAKYNGLRLLDLSYILLETNESINVACQLSHLRFVDLSFTGIKSIPDEFCALCHLEVLDVRGCNFDKLPEGMNQLVNMRHLHASANTISLISSIGKLTKLQGLEEFRVERRKGHRISELRDMNEISGHLLLTNLHNVSSKEEAVKCQLDKKKYLKSVELRFDYSERGPMTEVKIEVLNALKPTPSLEILKVGGCRWKSFPGWVFLPHPGLCNLKVIHVYCFWIERIPAFGELPFLEFLSFHDLPLIDTVGEEFYGHSDVAFPSLRELTFSEMSSWKFWEGAWPSKSMFPHLKKLHLKGCRDLYRLPDASVLSSVVELILSECPHLNITHDIENVLHRMPSLSHLSITHACDYLSLGRTPLNSLEVMHLSGIKELLFVGGSMSRINLRKLELIDIDRIYLDENEEQCFPALTYLHLGSSRIRSLSNMGMLRSLCTLLITDYRELEYTRQEESWFNQLTSLKKLEFHDCFVLRCLPSQLHMLTSLKNLHINCCPEMLSLPENGLPQNLAELYIDKCPNLIRRCQPNQGEDWHKITHIPFLHLGAEMGAIQVRSRYFVFSFKGLMVEDELLGNATDAETPGKQNGSDGGSDDDDDNDINIDSDGGNDDVDHDGGST
ncbi:disease resistance protein RGA2-like [Carex rostrata]